MKRFLANAALFCARLVVAGLVGELYPRSSPTRWLHQPARLHLGEAAPHAAHPSLGDSHTQGYEVREDFTFTAVAQRYLRAHAV